MFCYDDLSIAIYENLAFGMFSLDVPTLVYYSHFTAVIVSLVVSFFIFSNSKTLSARILVAIALTFATLSIIDVFLWTQIDARVLMYLWSFWLFLFITVYFLTFYFVYTFTSRKDLPFWVQAIGLTILGLILVLSVSRWNLEGFDVGNCSAVESVWALNIVFTTAFLTFISVMFFGLRASLADKDTNRRKTGIILTIGTGLFLLVFASMTYSASILNLFSRAPDTFFIEQYGYFGKSVFIAFLTFVVIRYGAFNVKLIAAQAMVIAFVILIVSQFFFIRSTTNIVLNAVALGLAVLFGVFLIKSIQREIEQKTLAQRLATELAGANARLERLDKMKSEFVSIASHQLRSPLTSIRGYVSMILEGSYGEVGAKTKEILTHVGDSARHMALSIDDFLNVSRIEAGNMNYDIVDADLRPIVEDIVSDMQPVSAERGISLILKVGFEGAAVVKLDVGKTRQIIQNLVDNAFKYSKGKEAIEITMRKDTTTKKVYIDVKDQGIGLSAESIANLFGKFERAHNASSTNVSGSGLGLYIARTMARAMGGDITVTSAGEGQGSTFTAIFALNGIESTWNKKA